jgi:ABC-type antimicrobial peptide transport system permease subunit
MFFTYLWRELRRRARQAIFIAIGLALGIGLVITVTAAASGVKNAQASVLHSLYGVGTDITVTKTPTTSSTGAGGFGFSFRQSVGSSSRPKAGTTIDDNTLTSDFTLGSLKSSDVTTVANLKNVAAAAGGLTLTDRTVSGKVPSFNTGSGGGGFGGSGGTGGTGGSGGGFTGGGTSTFNTNSFVVDGVDIANGELGPLSTGKITSGRTFTTSDESSDVALVDSSYATTNKLKVGQSIAVGNSKGKATTFKIVGIVTEPAGDDSTNVYVPLGVAQTLADLKGDVNTIYVAATNGQDITSVASDIKSSVSGATITDQDTLASQVTGSISSAASLANNLGKWLAIAVLIAAFFLASLLTMSAVSRRIREFGTLKALGWKSRRVVGQVMGESIAIGIVGGALGVGLGFLGAWAVGKFAHPLTATLNAGTTGSATPGGARSFTGGGFPGGGEGGFPGGTTSGSSGFTGGFAHAATAASTVTEHLTAPVTIGAVLAAVVLAVLGGLIAGSFGGWRAARLRPAAALSKVA